MSDRTIYKSALLIDGTGREPLRGAFMLVEGGRVLETGRFDPSVLTPENGRVVDLQGKTIVPGVVDAHVHVTIDPDADFAGFVGRDSLTRISIRGMNNLRKTLHGGVTYIRDLGSYRHVDIELKKCLAEGLIEGPGFLAAGEMITMTGGHGWKLGRECDGPADARKAAREQIKAGADVIKIMATGGNLTPGAPGAPQLSEEEIRAAVEEAHKAGKKTTTHAHSAEGVKNALRAGIDCIEHGMYIDEEALRYMLDHDIYYVPTLVGPWICAEVGEERGLAMDAVRKTKSSIQRHMQSFQLAQKIGVKIGMGTDAGTPFCEHGKGYIDELRLMVSGGFTPMQAIVAATRTSSEILGISANYGTLEKGKTADFLVLNQNPLDDVGAYGSIHDVYQNGVRVKRE